MSRFLAPIVFGCVIWLHATSQWASADNPGFRKLFNGSDLAGWQHSGNWKVVDGAITRTGSGGNLTLLGGPLPNDFELRFEWKVAEGSNSGIYYRPGQYEYQVLDNDRHRDGQNPRTSAASLYFCMPPSKDATRPAGEWNEGRILCQGTIIQHWLNGVKVVDFDYTDPKWVFNVDLLKKRGGNVADRGGKLWLQDHGDPVWYRGLELRNVKADEDVGHSSVQPAAIPAEALKKEAEKIDGILKRRRQAIEAKNAKSSRKPNIIYVMADDLGYGDLGCYGQNVIQTPNLDRMAAEGIRFTDHYAGHTVCRPSRLVLWTGKHVGHTRLIGNAPRSLTGQEATVAKLLKQAGYRTGGVGKWALGNVETPDDIDNIGHPNNNGFDEWFGYLNQSNAHNYYPTFLWNNRRQVSLPGNKISVDPLARGRVSTVRETYSHDLLVEHAFDFIRESKGGPFLLHMHLTIPHANNEGGRVNGDGMEVPDYGIYADKQWPNPEKGFAAMITRMDTDMGRLFDLLKSLRLDDNTLVIFTSDNGPHHEGRHSDEFFKSSGPLQGSKRSMHEGGIRVPMIARWPGNIAAGTTSDHPSAFWDYLPTACEVAGVDVPAGIDGISYLPSLLGRSNQPKHDYLYWASSEGKTSVGIRSGNWKLVNYPNKKNSKDKRNANPMVSDDGWQLFDLSEDPGETKDLTKEKPDLVKRMLQRVGQDNLF